MKVAVPVAVALVAIGLLAMTSSSQTFTAPWAVPDPRGWSDDADPYQRAADIAASWGAPVGVQSMVRYQLATESRGQAAASLGVERGAPPWVPASKASMVARGKEAYAARVGYQRIKASRRAVWSSAGWGSPSWSFGSGGLYGLLPSTGMATVVRSDPSREWVVARKASPWDIFDPARGTACYVDFLRRVAKFSSVKRWVDFKLAGASLATLGNQDGEVAQRIIARAPIIAVRAGLNPQWPLGDIDAASRKFLAGFSILETAYV